MARLDVTTLRQKLRGRLVDRGGPDRSTPRT
jgi:hypothetical protein